MSGLERVGGYRMDLEDHAWLKANDMDHAVYAAAMAEDFKIPDVVDPKKITVIRNQGHEGSCQGHAITGAAGMAYFGKTGTWKRFSADAAYYLTQRIDGITGDNGSTIAGGMKYATTIGVIPEEAMPYRDTYNPQCVPANYKELGEPFLCFQHKILKTFDDVVQWIGRGFGGVSWGTCWGVKLDANNLAHFTHSGGGHARHISGYNLKTRTITEDNSWSEAWGDHGRCHWTEAEFNKAAADSYTVIVGITDMKNVDFKPRVVDFTKTGVMG